MMPLPRLTRPRRPRSHRRSPDAGPPIPADLLLLAAALVAALALICARVAAADAATRLGAPQLSAPANGATVASAPSFSWQRTAGAARYEFQLSANRTFGSIVANGQGTFKTANTFATVDRAVAEGDYFWRVRAVDTHDRVGRWSPVRTIFKRWTVQMTSPPDGATVNYPQDPLLLTWAPVPGAYKYLVNLATDESMGHSLFGGNGTGVETSGTVAAVPMSLAEGDYYWTVVPMDAQRHSGTAPTPFKVHVSWPTTGLSPQIANLFTPPDGTVMDPQFSWTGIPGASAYQVEVNSADDWAVGSKVCCDELASGTALSPLALLPNNTYHWRVRAINPDGHAGVWNVGPDFKKGFLPKITGLKVRDNIQGHALPPDGAGVPTTDAPVVQWDPVPGASSYEVQVAPWQGTFCNWSANDVSAPNQMSATTATAAWTPLGSTTSVIRPVGNGAPLTTTSFWKLWQDETYCVRVRARTDRDAKLNQILSDWTQIGGPDHPAFHYASRFPNGCNGSATRTPASAYHDESGGGTFRGMPLLTWDWVPGACGYFVVVARDAEFTDVVDVAFTNYPAYAPRGSFGPLSYPDETTSYYWAVMPTASPGGDGLSTAPQQDSPQSFQKLSIAPSLVSPAPGAVVTGQPSFRWNPVQGALDYRVQVDDDPSFSSPLDDVRTHSTGFTSLKTYPADSVLYWRVRADAESTPIPVGLNWSQTGQFHRDLPTPTVPAGNPIGGDTVPMLRWNPVPGAVSYDIHFEQSDGTKRDFNVRSTAFTATAFYGTGVWRWQVRANYLFGFQRTSSGYTPLLPFTRYIATPTGLRTANVAGGGALLSWAPAPMARQYKVQIATSTGFSTVIDQAIVDGTAFAPHMLQPQYATAPRLYWRVAAVDEGGNIGGWATAGLRAPLPMRVGVSGTLRHGRAAALRVRVSDGHGHRLFGAHVRATGARMKAMTRSTSRRGMATLRVRPGARGSVTVRVSLRGYVTRRVRVRVR